MIANKKISLCVLIILLVILCYGALHLATDRSVHHLLTKLPQNALAYVATNKNPTVLQQEQTKLTQEFIQQYFYPWDENFSTKKLLAIKAELLKDYKAFAENPGIGANTHAYTGLWVKNLANNTDLDHFPNANQNAITIRDSNIRILPTAEPSFADFRSISKGYPFDNLQQTFIPAGTPIHIIQISNDKAWYLIVGNSFSGWIPDQDIAFVNAAFIKSWRTGQYAVSTQDDIPLIGKIKQVWGKTRIGVLYPIKKRQEHDYEILMPSLTTGDFAVAKSVIVNKKFLLPFPLSISSKKIAEVANNLLGKPYGWGGVYGYRDCSSTTKDLMATFGIWLPRNSSGQIEQGNYISLKGLSDSEKEKTIIRRAVPFLTLIHIPGHIVLYVGEKNGHPLVFQNMWGLHIYKLFTGTDRIVIGETVITPLCFGKDFINVSFNPLTGVDGMTILAGT